MAEVSGAFSQEELLKLKDQAMAACDRVTRKNHSLPPLKTAKGNPIIGITALVGFVKSLRGYE